MSDNDEMSMSYVHHVRDETRRYVEKLLTENEGLRARLAKTDSELATLEEEIGEVREELQRRDREASRLEGEIEEIQAQNRRFTEEYDEIERHNANLANLYVASYRLHGTLDRDEVLGTIHEILINLVGSEEIAVYELDHDRAVLRLVSSFGIDEERYGIVALGSGPIGRAAESGELFIGGAGGEENITACVPLKANGELVGIITVFSLLPQKPALEAVDHELFQLLGTHAATSLYCSALHRRLESMAEAAS